MSRAVGALTVATATLEDIHIAEAGTGSLRYIYLNSVDLCLQLVLSFSNFKYSVFSTSFRFGSSVLKVVTAETPRVLVTAFFPLEPFTIRRKARRKGEMAWLMNPLAFSPTVCGCRAFLAAITRRNWSVVERFESAEAFRLRLWLQERLRLRPAARSEANQAEKGAHDGRGAQGAHAPSSAFFPRLRIS